MYTVKRIWIDDTEEMREGSVDVLAEMEDSSLWMARFVTIPYLREQMEYGRQGSQAYTDAPEIRYATIETRHVIVDRLDLNTIEDVIDNLLALDVFESMFEPISGEVMHDMLAANGANIAGMR